MFSGGSCERWRGVGTWSVTVGWRGPVIVDDRFALALLCLVGAKDVQDGADGVAQNLMTSARTSAAKNIIRFWAIAHTLAQTVWISLTYQRLYQTASYGAERLVFLPDCSTFGAASPRFVRRVSNDTTGFQLLI